MMAELQSAAKRLGEIPAVHPTALVRHSELGPWTEVGARTEIIETSFGGNPARLVRRRFPRDVAGALLAIAWWDWERERLHDALDDFRRLEVEAFIEKHRA